jgi:hypothetical protein
VPLFSTSGPLLTLSSFIVGAFVPGIVAITIGRTRELIPGDPSDQAAAWSYCTTAFALGQAIAGYGFAYILPIFSHEPTADTWSSSPWLQQRCCSRS